VERFHYITGLALALRFDGRERKHDAAEMIAAIVAKRLLPEFTARSPG
jgi:hypothetical protein